MESFPPISDLMDADALRTTAVKPLRFSVGELYLLELIPLSLWPRGNKRHSRQHERHYYVSGGFETTTSLTVGPCARHYPLTPYELGNSNSQLAFLYSNTLVRPSGLKSSGSGIVRCKKASGNREIEALHPTGSLSMHVAFSSVTEIEHSTMVRGG